MFFIGIFGIDYKEKEIKIIENFYCKACTEGKTGKLIKRFSYFHFFFIPILKWNEHYYIVCQECQKIYEISKEKGKACEKDNEIQISYWDLMESKSPLAPRICSNCGREVDDEYKFCPYCGNNIK